MITYGLCSPIDQIEQQNEQLKDSKIETIIEIDDGRLFPATKFKFSLV